MLDKYEKIPDIPEIDEEQNFEYVTVSELNKILEEKVGDLSRKRRLGGSTEIKEGGRKTKIINAEDHENDDAIPES